MFVQEFIAKWDRLLLEPQFAGDNIGDWFEAAEQAMERARDNGLISEDEYCEIELALGF